MKSAIILWGTTMGTDVPFLVLESAAGERIPLKNPTTLGRTQGNDVVLPVFSCSSRHARIRRDQGGWVIEDLGSTNGTWINGERITGMRVLQENDLIQIGGQNLRIQGLAAELPCARCGAVPVAGASFCPSCGLPLQSVEPSMTVAIPPPAQPFAKAEDKPEKSAPEPGPAQAATPAKRGKGWLVAIPIGLLILLALPVFVFWPRLMQLRPWSRGAVPSAASASKLPPDRAVLRQAILFRKGASSSNLPKIIEDDAYRDAFQFLRTSDSFKNAPALWSYFFSGTVMLGGQLESPSPVVAFYNPFLDGVMLTQWETRNGQPRVTAAEFRTASTMAHQTSHNPRLAWWLSEMPKRPIPVVLKEQYTTFLAAFAKAFPVESAKAASLDTGQDSSAERAVMERQALASLANLVHLQDTKSPVFSQKLVVLKHALQSGDSAAMATMVPANNPMRPQEIVAQPSWIRRSAVPIYALTGAKRTIVLLAPSDAPRFYLLAAWTGAPASRLEMLAPYDMDGTSLRTTKNGSVTEAAP